MDTFLLILHKHLEENLDPGLTWADAVDRDSSRQIARLVEIGPAVLAQPTLARLFAGNANLLSFTRKLSDFGFRRVDDSARSLFFHPLFRARDAECAKLCVRTDRLVCSPRATTISLEDVLATIHAEELQEADVALFVGGRESPLVGGAMPCDRAPVDIAAPAAPLTAAAALDIDAESSPPPFRAPPPSLVGAAGHLPDAYGCSEVAAAANVSAASGDESAALVECPSYDETAGESADASDDPPGVLPPDTLQW